MNNTALYRVGVIVIAACAMVSTMALVRREMSGRPTGQQKAPSRVAEWQIYGRVGNAVGPTDAPVVVVVFSDFQCPFCRRFAAVVDTARRAYPNIRIVERHLPLTSIHPAAHGAALAAECGRARSRYWEVRDALYRKRLAVEDGEWGTIARAAGIRDTAAFGDCVRSSRYAAEVARDTVDASRLGLMSTPAVLVNDALYRGALTLASFEAAVRRAGRGTNDSP